MTDRASHQAQREALKELRKSPPSTRQEVHGRAVDRYIQMQDMERRRAESGGSWFGVVSRLARRRRKSGTWHEQVNVEGHEVDVTEDELGIVEVRER